MKAPIIMISNRFVRKVTSVTVIGRNLKHQALQPARIESHPVCRACGGANCVITMGDGGRPPRASARRQEHASVTVCKHARRAAQIRDEEAFASKVRRVCIHTVWACGACVCHGVCVSSWLGGCKANFSTVERYQLPRKVFELQQKPKV